MTDYLLRSGCPDDYLSLGENGRAVFDSALQIRETLRLRNLQAALEILAIPQINDSRDRIDWYAPLPGVVIDWASASDSQRASAFTHLTHCMSQLRLLSCQCQTSEKTSLRLFGLLLNKAMQFPDSQHLWLIDGKPVIAFWGFVHQGDTAREDILACLQTCNAESTLHKQQKYLPKTEGETGAVAQTKITAPEVITANSETAARREGSLLPRIGSNSSRRYGCMAVIIALGSGSYWITHSTQTEQATSFAQSIAGTESPPAKRIDEVSLLHSSLPLMQATVESSFLPVTETVNPVPPVPSVKETLTMSAKALKQGSTQFLNGIWTVYGDANAVTSPQLRYRITNNKGTVSLFNQNHVRCKAEVFSGLHRSGILMIKARGSARCSDGSRYQLPEISCKAGDKAIADCTGRYPDGSRAPVTFEKVSK